MSNVYKDGDLVQFTDENITKDGTVISIIPSKVLRTNDYWRGTKEVQQDMTTYAVIKWDNGLEEKLSTDDLDPRDSELERKFRLEAPSVLKQINEKLSIASQALSEAEELAEKHGIPFSSDVSPLAQSYYPSSLNDKFGEMEHDLVNSITGAYHSEYGEEGWQHSAVCY